MPKLDRPGREWPFRLSQLDELFDRWLSERLPFRWPNLFPTIEADWSPPVDLIDKKTHVVVRAEVPGVRKEDIDVSVTEDSVTIRGSVQKEAEQKGECYYCSERAYGSFARMVRLPGEVIPSKAKASLKDGVLEIKLPKKAERKAKTVKIQVK